MKKPNQKPRHSIRELPYATFVMGDSSGQYLFLRCPTPRRQFTLQKESAESFIYPTGAFAKPDNK